MTKAESSEVHRFGDFVRDVAAYDLRRQGRAVRLEQQPMDLLILLVSRRGKLVSRDEIIASGTLSAETYDAAERLCQTLFAEGQRWAASRGLVLVDTKYEIAQRADGALVVVDEIHTPDSSRYWYRDRYERALTEGRTPEALDKEYVRRWLGEKGYKGDGPPPELPVDVRCEASRRYIEAFEQITGRDFEPDTEDPRRRIARNLGIA